METLLFELLAMGMEVIDGFVDGFLIFVILIAHVINDTPIKPNTGLLYGIGFFFGMATFHQVVIVPYLEKRDG